MLETYLNYLSRRKEETSFIEGLIRNNNGINKNIKYANQLRQCTQRLLVGVKDNGDPKILPVYPCGVPFCPTCEFLKTRKKVAQFRDIYNRITRQPDLVDPRFYFLTLTVRHCHATELVDTVTEMKKAYQRLRRRKEVKDAVLSASCFLHYGLNSNDYIRPHFHVLLIMNPPGRNYIRKSDWEEMWCNSLNSFYIPHVYFQSIGNRGRAQKDDFIKVMQYGLKAVEYQNIEKYPGTFLSLFDVGKSIRKISHQGLIRTLKRESEEAYRSTLMKVPSEDEYMLMKYDGSKFHEDRLVVF
jgi:plasmid rolling circle replication initiator protein Rep